MKSFKEAKWEELTASELQNVNGGSEFSEAVFRFLGATVSFIVEAVKDAQKNPIRPSEYR
jgi:bacteriocin-like protein